MEKTANPSRNEEILCPICGRELLGAVRKEGGWQCRCGEFVPESSAISAFEGCTHGRECNCGRRRPRQ